LRGALGIDGIRIRQGQWAINVSHISLHVSTSVMLSPSIRVSRLRLDGMLLSIPRAELTRWLQSTPPNMMTEWFSVTNHVDELILVNGRVHFTDEKNPWQVRKVSGHVGVDGFDLSGNLNRNGSGGLIRLHGERHRDSFSGMMDWQDMAMSELVRTIGLKVKPHGSSGGLLHWHTDWPNRRFDFDGDVQLAAQPGRGDMHIQGKMKADNIQM